MTVVVDDPLTAGMAITRTLPLHESSRRLRELYPECPRVYGVAVMGDVPRRRWWPLAAALTTDRLDAMFDTAVGEMGARAAAAQRLATALAHVVIGRVVPLVVLEGRGWDTGLENLWVAVDSEGAIDWVGVVYPALRVLPDDPFFSDRGVAGAAHCARAGIVRLPSEAALAGSSELTSMRRGQAVRSTHWSGSGCRCAVRPDRGKGRACLIRAALPILASRNHRTAPES